MKINVLLVDDKPENLYSLEAVLNDYFNDLALFMAHSGEDALRLCFEEEIDLVFLDIQMPIMDGFEVAELLHKSKKTRDIPIVFLTAVFNSHEFIRRGFELGAIDYLTKPIDESQLINKLSFYLKFFAKDKELKSLYKELRETHTLFNQGKGLMFKCDANDKLLFISANITQYGYSQNLASLYDMMFDGDKMRVKHERLQALGENKEEYSLTYPIYSHDNSVWLLEYAKVVRGTQGEHLYTLGYAIDITHEKKIEEQLRLANIGLEQKIEEAIEKNRQQEQLLIQQSKMAAMGEMIGAIAHQWRQPLNALSITIQDIEDAYEYGELDEKYIHNIIDKSMRYIGFMSKTIDDFRNFFMPSKAKFPFSVVDAISEVIGLFLAQLKNHDIRLSFRCLQECDDPKGCLKEFCTQDNGDKIFICTNHSMHVEGYENEFKQVILNIINNAKDAILSTKQQGVIAIRAFKKNQRITIEIEDNGGGIPDNVLPRIFEPYFTTKSESKGTGIGLYMAKTIVEKNMNGTVDVYNTKQGACFTLTLNGVE